MFGQMEQSKSIKVKRKKEKKINEMKYNLTR